MSPEITDHEKDIIECWVSGWAKDDMEMGMYGPATYQCAYDLCKKLRIAIPDNLEQMIDGRWAARMLEITDRR